MDPEEVEKILQEDNQRDNQEDKTYKNARIDKIQKILHYDGVNVTQ